MEIEDEMSILGGFRPDFQETFPLRVPSPPQACVFCMQVGDGHGCPVKGGHNDISVGIGLSQSYCGGGNRTWVQGGAPGTNFYRLYGRSIHSSQAYKPRKIPGGDLVDISAQNQHLFSKKKESHRTLV